MKQAVITGATSGIGRAIAKALHEEGLDVIGIGRDADALAQLEEAGICPLQLDLRDRAAVAAAMHEINPDILVNNAGVMAPLVNFCDLPETEIARLLTLNLTCVLDLTRLVAPKMRQRKSGHIFFTGSVAGHAPYANMAVYCATKAAIAGFAQALRLDMAPHGVRVTEIVAGRVETSLYDDLLPPAQRAAMYAGNTAIQPQDVASMLVSVWKLPAAVDVSRFDILPTQQATATGAQDRK